MGPLPKEPIKDEKKDLPDDEGDFHINLKNK